MFGCTDPDQVLREIMLCTKAFPDAFIRLVAFDNKRQVPQQVPNLEYNSPTRDEYVVVLVSNVVHAPTSVVLSLLQ